MTLDQYCYDSYTNREEDEIEMIKPKKWKQTLLNFKETPTSIID
jgi:hypothetical protein